jgi:NADPH-dependent curcumin reductase CurA
MRAILRKSLTIRGFIQREFADQRPDFYQQAGAWISEGRLKYKEDIVDGLENAPEAFLGLLEGKNFGKLIVRVAP